MFIIYVGVRINYNNLYLIHTGLCATKRRNSTLKSTPPKAVRLPKESCIYIYVNMYVYILHIYIYIYGVCMCRMSIIRTGLCASKRRNSTLTSTPPAAVRLPKQSCGRS